MKEVHCMQGNTVDETDYMQVEHECVAKWVGDVPMKEKVDYYLKKEYVKYFEEAGERKTDCDTKKKWNESVSKVVKYLSVDCMCDNVD